MRQTLFFSATLDGRAGDLASRYTSRAIVHEQRPPSGVEKALVEHRFVPVRDEQRLEALIEQLNADCDRTIVFVRTKRGADRLVKRLDARGLRADAIHGNKSQSQRDRALSRFQSGRVDTLVATDLAARGIDVDGVSHVINFDPPSDHHTYIHRVGRTGRAGNRGVGVTLVGAGERHEMRQLARRLGLSHGLGGEERGAQQVARASRRPRGRRPECDRRPALACPCWMRPMPGSQILAVLSRHASTCVGGVDRGEHDDQRATDERGRDPECEVIARRERRRG